MQFTQRCGLIAYYSARSHQAAMRARGMNSASGRQSMIALSEVWKSMAALEEKHSLIRRSETQVKLGEDRDGPQNARSAVDGQPTRFLGLQPFRPGLLKP